VFEITKPFLHFGLRFCAGNREMLLYFYSNATGWNDYFSNYVKGYSYEKD
jgi:hypothetical protein